MKSVLKSRTIWFNTLTILLTVATFYGFTPDQQLAERTTGIVLVFAPAINFLLRFLTTQPVSIKGE